MKKLQELRGFPAFVLHPPNGYLQPVCTLILALAVVSVGSSIARESQNREMCARLRAYEVGAPQPLEDAHEKKLADRIGVPPMGSARRGAAGFCEYYD